MKIYKTKCVEEKTQSSWQRLAFKANLASRKLYCVSKGLYCVNVASPFVSYANVMVDIGVPTREPLEQWALKCRFNIGDTSSFVNEYG